MTRVQLDKLKEYIDCRSSELIDRRLGNDTLYEAIATTKADIELRLALGIPLESWEEQDDTSNR